MHKLIKLLTFAIIFAAIMTTVNISSAKADVGEFPSPGGTITTGDKTDAVAMKSEEVIFTVKKNDGSIKIGETTPSYYAHVKASFTMSNLTGQQQSMQLFFPFHSNSIESFGAPNSQSANITIAVNGQNVTPTYSDNIFTNSNQTVTAAIFNADFAPNADTNITVEYDLRAVNNAKSADLVLSYMMETGSHWAGNIGSGKVVFDFEQDITSKAEITSINDFFKIQDGNLVWEFTNLEPNADQNIELVFNPEIMDIWSKRPSFITNISSNHLHDKFYQPGNIRTDSSYPGGFISTSAINLLNYQTDGAGWLVPQNQGVAAFDDWVEFEFDGKYTISELQIRGGYQSYSYEDSAASDQNYFDTYRRPKTVVITYSDGSTQEVILQDQPSEYQTIALNNTQTTSLKLSFKDAYNGTGNGNGAFGVGRVKFVNVTKIAKEQQPANQTNSTPVINYQPFIIGGAAAVIVIAGVTVWIIRKKRAKRINISPKNTGESATLPKQPKKAPKK